uniref:Uncharacterized protein n=1 Tax=Glossina morsitans morsitans TaxID=37546 RepID=A0ABK9NFV4_GLOMM
MGPIRRLMLSPIHMRPESAAAVVKADVVLRNFVKMHDGSLCETTRLPGNDANSNDVPLRETLKNYLNQNST